jgi:hypothetical protein
LIGITNDAEVAIRVDYARTVEEIYSEATEYLINTEGNVDMLLDGRVSRERDPLPTWIPQFASIKTTEEAGTPDAFRASSEKPVAEIIHWEPSIPCGCTGRCLKLRGVKFDKIVRRAAIAAEGVIPDVQRDAYAYREQVWRSEAAHVYHFEVFSSGGNSDRLAHSGSKPNRSTRYGPYGRTSHGLESPRLHEECSFLDWILQALAIDLAQPPLLKLERLPQIGLLFADYLLNGTQSLEKVMEHQQNSEVRRIRLVGGDWSLMRAELVRLHRLPERHALLQDLELAMQVQFQVLGKIAKWKSWPSDTMRNGEVGRIVRHPDDYVRRAADTVNREAGSIYSPDSGYERVLFKTEDQYLGVGPGDLQIGDEVVVPFGSSRPWVLRSHGDHHILVGDAFVPGIMTGQLEELWRRGDLEYTDYVLR